MQLDYDGTQSDHGAASFIRVKLMMNSHTTNRSIFIAGLIICWCSAWYTNSSWGSSISLLEQALDGISAKGDSIVTVSGDLNSACNTGSSNTICVGTYVWSDDHSNDASVNKGALVLSGNVQENLVTNINVNSSVSPTATGVNTIGTVTPSAGSTLNLSNNNNATGFIGGF